jgi:threonine synthase
MSKTRGEKIQDEITALEDAILYAESKGVKGLEEAKNLINKVKRFFEQGTWSMAEKGLSKAIEIKNSKWYLEFMEKRKEEKGNRFVGDGLCGKYGHLMVKVRLSNVRWYYQCRLCKKRGKSQSIK